MSAPSTEVGPGLLAFVAFFVLAVALWLLMRSMFKRLRRMSLAERAEQERRQAERQEEERAREELLQRARETELPESGGRVGDGPEEGQGRSDEV